MPWLYERVRTRLALASAANGDWQRARERLEACLADYPGSTARPALLAALLQAASRTGAARAATDALAALDRDYPDDPHTARAHRWVGRAQ
jgi:TolA-binding protein